MADVGRPGNGAFPELASSWLPPHELQRLAAYKVLASYDNNQAGQLAAASGDEAALERRELGDAANLVDTALGYLLGSDQQISVAGAEHADEEAPEPSATAAVFRRVQEHEEGVLLQARPQFSVRDALYVQNDPRHCVVLTSIALGTLGLGEAAVPLPGQSAPSPAGSPTRGASATERSRILRR
ncbi:hypothetical protein J7E96_20025 [Streptomyces sp. ISL-96]|uniref:hypothetical protein n=1 Tax=Streptomyces sp. ISL-96 TaxID=2819191 RepID=UPI001BE97F6A|nr:hypothetical protein [Streptomyces sp. ISL-96]MBT2490761.1 hypothetical protein [Streptomyces sp. ISL-96]